MTWSKTPADRRRDAQVYGPEWRKQRQRALTRAGHRCQRCGATSRLTVDHITPVTRGGTHEQGNLQVLCQTCHRTKTAAEGGGYRTPKREPPADLPARPTTNW